MDIDKLLEQEPEFKTYLQELAFKMLTDQKDSHVFIGAVYSFYVSGMTTSQVQQWIKSMNIIGGENNGDFNF